MRLLTGSESRLPGVRAYDGDHRSGRSVDA
jgi:hypothetical protein